jgi:hypothetical protein
MTDERKIDDKDLSNISGAGDPALNDVTGGSQDDDADASQKPPAGGGGGGAHQVPDSQGTGGGGLQDLND